MVLLKETIYKLQPQKSYHKNLSREQLFLYSLVRLLNSYYDKVLCKFKGRLYTLMFNLRSIIINSKSRIYPLKRGYIVIDKDRPEITQSVYHEKNASYAYKFGLRERANSLANEYLLNNIEFKENDIIYDCGANYGDFKLYFYFNNLNVKYIAFEPSPTEFEFLKKNIYPSDCFNIGLWNREGLLDFFLSSQEADSSFIKPRYFNNIIKVKTKKLENIIQGPIKLLKLEAEGAEPEILEGIGSKLSNIEYITADLGFERGKTEESTLVPVNNFLLQNGFKLVDINHNRVVALFKNKSK